VSGEVASSAAVGPPPGMRVRLSSNESAFGPPPGAIAAAGEVLGRAHLYPDDQAVALREALAAFEGLELDQVAVGTGSAALLMDAIAHACADGGSVVSFERAFIVYRLAAKNAGVRYLEAPTAGPATADADGYVRDVDALLELVEPDAACVVVDNPGNPTGAHLDGEQLRALAAGVPEHTMVIVDEAYHQFAVGRGGYQTVDALGLEHPRLVTMRTFSKAYALAGMRIGYVVGPADVVMELDARRTRFNVTAPAQAAAIAALDDRDHLERTVAATLQGRDRMVAGLRELGIPVTGGLGNFVTLELGTAAAPIVEAYAEHGVGVRPLAPYGMMEQLRVTVGTPDEVDAFLTASADVLGEVPSRS
jgi:histidinol-phosphate aminotransferase